MQLSNGIAYFCFQHCYIELLFYLEAYCFKNWIDTGSKIYDCVPVSLMEW